MKLWLSRQNIWFIIIGFTLCSFAFSERINSWGIIALCLFFLADRNLITKIKKPFSWRKVVPLIILFVVYLCFFIFSEKDAEASHALVSKLSLVLLPVLLSYESYFDKKNETRLVLLFSFVLLLGAFYGLGMSFLENFNIGAKSSGWPLVLNRMNVSKAVMHPGYYSNYFMFVIIWHFYNKTKFQYFFIALFTLVLLLLLSRIVILFYILFVGMALLRIIKKAKKPFIMLPLVFAAVFICAFLLYQIPTVQNRIKDTITGLQSTDKEVDYSSATASRTVAYQAEINLIKEKPILGYGLGNAVNILQEELRNTGYHKLAEKMHIHNQYFHTWLQTGIVGIMALLFMIVILIQFFYKEKVWVAFWFTILVALYLLTDDMLEIQAGIVFFASIWALYLFQKKEITTP